MNALGINRGTSGNLSVRIAGGLLITPSGVPYDSLRPGKIVAMQIDGSHTGAWEPSSEWRLHRDIYRARENTGAVVHAHPGFATALACLRRGIPAFHYMIAVAGGSDIRCAPYATFGTQALSDGALQALDGRTACLLANHGMVCLGSDLAAALALAVEVEGARGAILAGVSARRPETAEQGADGRGARPFRNLRHTLRDQSADPGDEGAPEMNRREGVEPYPAAAAG